VILSLSSFIMFSAKSFLMKPSFTASLTKVSFMTIYWWGVMQSFSQRLNSYSFIFEGKLFFLSIESFPFPGSLNDEVPRVLLGVFLLVLILLS